MSACPLPRQQCAPAPVNTILARAYGSSTQPGMLGHLCGPSLGAGPVRGRCDVWGACAPGLRVVRALLVPGSRAGGWQATYRFWPWWAAGRGASSAQVPRPLTGPVSGGILVRLVPDRSPHPRVLATLQPTTHSGHRLHRYTLQDPVRQLATSPSHCRSIDSCSECPDSRGRCVLHTHLSPAAQPRPAHP